jgi:hypothetical protein
MKSEKDKKDEWRVKSSRIIDRGVNDKRDKRDKKDT